LIDFEEEEQQTAVYLGLRSPGRYLGRRGQTSRFLALGWLAQRTLASSVVLLLKNGLKNSHFDFEPFSVSKGNRIPGWASIWLCPNMRTNTPTHGFPMVSHSQKWVNWSLGLTAPSTRYEAGLRGIFVALAVCGFLSLLAALKQLEPTWGAAKVYVDD